ncbi:hypothetical protein A3D88_03065 [Candidatus Peribacteria bacterium RIFCSPHIGHO2_02_FULL_52_16]|nr:MAG: hypothetical protein A2706_01540 [Candidatus Peribacteria bacterium RIFCSPHIGHO2_01_FULL_51_35]OGJ60661.1 MAG: hypothetical protein A3D88_03065 [Candidatus Peribacteria bacterium RIFCSPHIGHO2_02_FULL_52_16]
MSSVETLPERKPAPQVERQLITLADFKGNPEDFLRTFPTLDAYIKGLRDYAEQNPIPQKKRSAEWLLENETKFHRMQQDVVSGRIKGDKEWAKGFLARNPSCEEYANTRIRDTLRSLSDDFMEKAAAEWKRVIHFAITYFSSIPEADVPLVCVAIQSTYPTVDHFKNDSREFVELEKKENEAKESLRVISSSIREKAACLSKEYSILTDPEQAKASLVKSVPWD